MSEGAMLWACTVIENGEIVRKCDYFKAGDLVRPYFRWDQPREVTKLVGDSVTAHEHGMGCHTERGSFVWVYNMERIEEVKINE